MVRISSVFRFQLNVFPLVGFLWLNFTEATRLWQITDSFFHLATSLQSKLLLLGINRQPVSRSLLLSPDGGPGTGSVLHQVGQVGGGRGGGGQGGGEVSPGGGQRGTLEGGAEVAWRGLAWPSWARLASS